MWTARTRYSLLLISTLILVGVCGLMLGEPGLTLIFAGEVGHGWLWLGSALAVDALIIGAAMLLSRRSAFRFTPIDVTLPLAERRRLARNEEERYRLSKTRPEIESLPESDEPTAT